jgi:hypothetical protein
MLAIIEDFNLPHSNLLLDPNSILSSLDKSEIIISLFKKNFIQDIHQRKTMIWIDHEINYVRQIIENMHDSFFKEDRDIFLQALSRGTKEKRIATFY